MRTINTFHTIAIIFLIAFSSTCFAQKPPAKFGKIDIKDLEATVCPIDSNAHAYFIFDYGTTKVEYMDQFQLNHHHHYRIKILDSEAFSWGEIKIPPYNSVSRIKAVTYNLENGEIVESKVKRKDIIHEKTINDYYTDKFVMPNVKEGSIIEIEYTLTHHNFIDLNSWYFQKTIPVLQSEYYVRYPEYFIYNQTMKGYFSVTTEKENTTKSIGSTMYTEKGFSYIASNIPAFPNEGYLRTRNNYISKIEFELQSISSPFTMTKNYASNWPTIVRNLLDNNYFGKELKKSFHLRKAIDSLKIKNSTGMELVDDALNYMKATIVWNKYYSKYTTETLPQAFRKGEGNVADINLNLVALIRELGFECYPVVLSTQSNGIIYPVHPSNDRLNYVIALVKYEGKDYLLDATDPFSEINLLPIRCLNDKGLIVKEGGIEWINLMGYRPYSLVETYNISITDDMAFKGMNEMKLRDYSAYLRRKSIKNFNTLDEYFEYAEGHNENLSLNNYEVVGLDSIKSDMTLKVNFKHENQVDKTGNLAMFSPAYEPFYEKNPFKLDNREYPVEFDYPYSVQQIYTITIPEDYTVEEIPQPMILRMPDKSAQYIFNIKQLENKIFLTLIFKQKRMLYLTTEYNDLKAFYQTMIDKQKELVVLKKL